MGASKKRKRDPEMYGIVRMDYEKTTSGWRIRLGNKKNVAPRFAQTIKDSTCGGDRIKSLKLAQSIRDVILRLLRKEGAHSGRKEHQRRLQATTQNRSGVVGVARSKTGWRVHYRKDLEHRWQTTKTFRDVDYRGDSKRSFKAALMYRHKYELKFYGVSNIDPFRDINKYRDAMLFIVK